MVGNINYEELKKTIDLLKPDGELFEVRILKKDIVRSEVHEKTLSGYFTSFDSLASALHEFEGDSSINFFMTLNKVHPACYSRLQRDRFLKTKPTTSDSDILKHEWILVDLDPVRPSDVSSTNEEVMKAKEKADAIISWMHEKGCSDPVVALSGNGIHLLYRIDIRSVVKDKESEEFIQSVLKSIAGRFDDEFVKVDTTVGNPSRIFKLYGTVARKGSNTEDRPHRLSRIITIPEKVEYTEIEILQSIRNDGGWIKREC